MRAVILVLDDQYRRRYAGIVREQLRHRRAPDVRLFHTAAKNPQAAILFAEQNAAQVMDGCLVIVDERVGRMAGIELLEKLTSLLGESLQMMVVLGETEDALSVPDARLMPIPEDPQKPLSDLLREFLAD